jgi:hypothetical protein
VSNAVTHAQYERIKNDRTYQVITFDRRTNTRLGTASGLSIVQAMDEVLRIQARRGGDFVEIVVLHCDPKYTPGSSWRREDYDVAIKASMPSKETK